MLKKKETVIATPESVSAVSGKPETEQEMIARIMKGNGSSDEYTDKYHKAFPVTWR